MRLIAIVLFVATAALIVAGLSSHSVQRARVARAEVKILQHPSPPGHSPHLQPHAIQSAQHDAEAAERETRPFFDMQILLTAVLLPFCIFLIFRRYQDAPTKTFAFSSLGAIIAFWFYIPPPG